ncbi:MAG: hypothetical protein M1820_002508 [Bogoriella megaspora]|nr:MAG: hypothetical protein M1820_002508 [Bogoriella megaspora]
MSKERALNSEEAQPLAQFDALNEDRSPRRDSFSSASTTSLVLEHINGGSTNGHVLNGLNKPLPPEPYSDNPPDAPHRPTPLPKPSPFEVEDGPQSPYYPSNGFTAVDRKARRLFWILGALALAGWLLALATFISKGSYKHASTQPHDPWATASRGSGQKVTLDEVLTGKWHAMGHHISWIAGANGEDGLLLERGGQGGKAYLVVEDVRARGQGAGKGRESLTLMETGAFSVGSNWVEVKDAWPSSDLKKVLIVSEKESNWRHSFTGLYWIYDVETQSAEPLDPDNRNGRIQLASWSPTSDSIVFTRDNNMFIRKLSEGKVTQITKDGGTELFNGAPDWVYEEEVFGGNSAIWWCEDGKYIAYLRTDESEVPEYPIQYYLSRPSGTKPAPGEESYPDVREIKYPKAGAPNPIVTLRFYDVEKNQPFNIDIPKDFEDKDRLITEVVWGGKTGKVLVRETNRVSNLLKVIVFDVEDRSAKVVREEDVKALDGGWMEVSETTRYIPADPANGRPHDGYIDTVIHDGYDHLAYFHPIENSEPELLTSGKWEVVNAPSAVDLKKNYVYFVATKESSIQRHVYGVYLNGTGLEPVTDTSREGYYDVSFSEGSGFALMSYQGPNIPWQKVINTPSNSESFEGIIEENKELAKSASSHELPIEIYQTITVDGVELNLLERRPPHFDKHRTYPVLFQLYNGPGAQEVNKKFSVDFQSYIASALGYIVVTLDGRGTGFIGRSARTIVRGNIGYWEAHDQIAAAKIWAAKPYVDRERIAIWGWSYGGFMTLKTLEQDAGQTFKYGMAVAPVTDWRFYDSIYTERYMDTPQANPAGYQNATIANTTALGANVRFLVMHGSADDNVHLQNSLTLLDKLDLAGVENYDFHTFPDSDHSIFFHNANKMVYDRLNNWLINAFNGEWLRTESPTPKVSIDSRTKGR